MSFAFPDIDPNTSGAITHVQVPLDRYLGESFAAGQHDTVLNSLSRISEFNVADDDLTSPILDTETANKKWAIGNLKFTEPVRESVARVMNQRKRDEMDREFFLNQGSSMGRFLPGMAASILGSVSNPLDLGLMFIPFVGEEAAAAKATSVVGRIAARRLITREALKEVFPAAPKLTESVINGMVGQSLFEVPNIVASAQDQANYGPKQAAFNVFAGGAFAAAMHGLGAAMAKLGRGTREEMAKQALNQMLRDETIKVHQYVNVDEAAIWEKIKFDADAARSAAYNSINMDDIAGAVKAKYGETVASPAIQTPSGKVYTGESHASIEDRIHEYPDFKWPESQHGFVTDKGRFISREEAGKLVGLPDTGYNHLMWENDKLMSEQISTANPEQLGAAEFDRYNQLIEENPHLSKADALKKIMEERAVRRDRYLTSRTEIQEMIERERVKAIEDFVRQEQVKFEQTKQGRFDAMKQVEIDRQIAEGKILKDEEIQKAIPPEKFDGSADADLEKDVAALKKDLKVDEAAKEEQGVIQDLVTGIDKMIKSLDHNPKKMSLPLADLLTLGIGRPVLKALLIAIKEGLLLTNDLIRAIDHAFKKTEGVKDTPELREALTRAINDDTAKPLFTHTIQSELAKPQPFNVKPDRFTPQVIAAKLKQLPAPEQAMLKMAGIDQFMAKYKPTEMIDRTAFEEFVRNAMIEPEIRPMLNVASGRGRSRNEITARQLQHQLEGLGFKFDELGAIISDGKIAKTPDDFRYQNDLKKLYIDTLAAESKLPKGGKDELVDEFVSQNISVPIPFEKMEKPRTIFLAADQIVHVGSSHYEGVFPDKKRGTWTKVLSDAINTLKKNGYVFDKTGSIVTRPREMVAIYKKLGVDPTNVKKMLELFEESYDGELRKKVPELYQGKGNQGAPELGYFRSEVDYLVNLENKQRPAHKNMLAWMETHIVMMPDGRRVLHIFEVQSDVRQSFYIEHNPPDVTYGVYYLDDGTHKGHNQHKVFSTKAEAEKFLEQKIKDYQTWVQPLIDHTDEILMKAALQLAKREGLDGVVISDPRTAMLTQGHLGSISAGEGMGFTDGPWVGPGPKPDYLPPSQAAGMTQAYGNKLPTILRKATRKEGEAVELGGRHYLMEDSETPDVGSKGIEEFNKAFPGSDSPSGQFFPVKDLAPDKPFELFTPKQVEPPKPQLEAINAAVDCILKKVI